MKKAQRVRLQKNIWVEMAPSITFREPARKTLYLPQEQSLYMGLISFNNALVIT